MPPNGEPLANGVVRVNPALAYQADRLSLAEPAHRYVARWLLDCEMRGVAVAAGLNPPVAALERICQKFFGRLQKVASLAACQSLLSRALHIPRAEFGFLDGIRVGIGAASLVDGVGASLDGLDPLYVRAGVEEVLGTLIGLLTSLIGQDLTFGMLREVWPELPALDPELLPESGTPHGGWG